MGNAGVNSLPTPQLPRLKVPAEGAQADADAEAVPGSPMREGEAFVFDRNRPSRDEGAPYYTLAERSSEDEQDAPPPPPPSPPPQPRPRSHTISEGAEIPPPESEYATSRSILPTVFKWDGGGKQVFISGTFTEWKTIPMVKSHGDFVTIIDLPAGEHQYKYLVDGEWRHDPSEKMIDNGMGSKNNLVTVKNSDFEVFEALAKDSESVHGSEQREYSQEIPQFKPWEKTAGPPILPPHLLQVILNKDTPISCEPTLLPEPNHVMLNHLYALSIKDGVMVLSATHRYRKKYVTTLLYKPI